MITPTLFTSESGSLNMSENLKIDDLSKSYDHFQALASTQLSIQSGEICALVGMNGSGKSTLIQCMAGIIRPTTGKITITEFDLYAQEVQAKKALAFVPDVPRFYSELTAWEHLFFIAHAHEAHQGFEDRAETLLKEYGLFEMRDLYPHNYSRGMRLKLGLLIAFIRPFKVLLLDEPTSALDEESTNLLYDRLKQAQQAGAAIVLSTHDPQMVKQLANRVFRMEHGVLQEE